MNTWMNPWQSILTRMVKGIPKHFTLNKPCFQWLRVQHGLSYITFALFISDFTVCLEVKFQVEWVLSVVLSLIGGCQRNWGKLPLRKMRGLFLPNHHIKLQLIHFPIAAAHRDHCSYLMPMVIMGSESQFKELLVRQPRQLQRKLPWRWGENVVEGGEVYSLSYPSTPPPSLNWFHVASNFTSLSTALRWDCRMQWIAVKSCSKHLETLSWRQQNLNAPVGSL